MATQLKSALQILSLAVEADETGLFDEAVRLYDRGSCLLEQYLHSPPPSIQAATAVKTKLESYQQRSQYIKTRLAEKASAAAHGVGIRSQPFQKEPISPSDHLSPRGDDVSPKSSTPMSDLQGALDLARTARSEDEKGNYSAAFAAYRRCVEHFVRVIRTEPNDLIRASLTKTAKTYITRAELLKEFLHGQKGVGGAGADGQKGMHSRASLIDDEVFEIQQDLSDTTIEDENRRKGRSDVRVGPLTKEKTSTFWNDSGVLLFHVDIGHNLVSCGESLSISLHVSNRSSVAVASIKIYLEEIDISTHPNHQGLVESHMTTKQLNKCEYVKNGTFPLANGTYNGSVQYEIPSYAKLTDADHSSSFAREHLLRLQLHIPRHRNLVLEFPIRIVPPEDNS